MAPSTLSSFLSRRNAGIVPIPESDFVNTPQVTCTGLYERLFWGNMAEHRWRAGVGDEFSRANRLRQDREQHNNND